MTATVTLHPCVFDQGPEVAMQVASDLEKRTGGVCLVHRGRVRLHSPDQLPEPIRENFYPGGDDAA